MWFTHCYKATYLFMDDTIRAGSLYVSESELITRMLEKSAIEVLNDAATLLKG